MEIFVASLTGQQRRDYTCGLSSFSLIVLYMWSKVLQSQKQISAQSLGEGVGTRIGRVELPQEDPVAVPEAQFRLLVQHDSTLVAVVQAQTDFPPPQPWPVQRDADTLHHLVGARANHAVAGEALQDRTDGQQAADHH